jgi:flagellar L-ring protein precursor FlgH
MKARYRSHYKSSLLGLTALIMALYWPAHSGLRADSLWQDGQAQALVGDKRASKIGDLLSIIVQESNSTAKDTSTKTARSASVDANISTFLYSPDASGLLTHNGAMPALKANAGSGFDGGGKINNSERIVARISVRVLDVLPNNNLVVEGRRQTAFAGETQDIILRGIVRPEDISPNNTVFSFNVADSSIRFLSKGDLATSQRKGWFFRLWDKVTPF